MTDAQLNSAVARATGESPRQIRRLGFQLVGASNSDLGQDEDLGPNGVDWDGLPEVSSGPLREFFPEPALV
jgi:hypothetical protein